MEHDPDAAPFRLGEWLVEPSLNRVSRGESVRHVRPRLMDLLVFLAAHAGEVVTKDAILEHVWPQRFVAESVLSRSVADLRQLLDDDAGQPTFIETVSKRGYRLLKRTVRHDPGRSRPDARPSIVVLPFADLAPGHDQEYFCDGLAEDLTNGLAQLGGLRVIARTSAFAFKGRAIDVREVGRALDVGVLLEGSVQRSGDRVRVTVQLIDVTDGSHLWSRRFDRPAGDIFKIEDEIVESVVAALKVALLAERTSIPDRRTNVTPEAHDQYLKGRYWAARRDPDGLERALACFRAATRAAPQYAAAHAAIGECHCVMGFAGFARPSEVFPVGLRAAEQAIEIDPDSADAHAVFAHGLGTFLWRWAEAESHFCKALEVSPDHALARIWYSHLLAASGRFAEAIDQTERACERDPLSPTMRTTLGLALYHARSFERAEEALLAVLETHPGFALAHFFLGRLYMVQGRLDASIQQHSAAASSIPTAVGFLAGAWRRAGRMDRARDAARALERLSESRYVGPLAWFAANAGDVGAQLTWLERAADAREGSVPLMNTDPGVDHLRHEARFEAIRRQLGLPSAPRAR